MKKLGLIGGIAWPSTIDYYRLLCEGSQRWHRAQGAEGLLPTPPMMIESVVMSETRKLRGNQAGGEASWAAFDQVFRDALNRLESAGCDVAAIASNTPHARLSSIQHGVDIPVISILAETAKATANAGFKNALILGTAVTMRDSGYRDALAEYGVLGNQSLTDTEIENLQDIIDTCFYHINEKSRVIGQQRMLEACRKFVKVPDDTAILLACTELPLAFPEHIDDAIFSAYGFHFVNSTVAHVHAILDSLLDR